MNKISTFLAIVLFATGCASKTPRDFQSYRWMDGTNILDAVQVAKLVNLLDINLVPFPKTAEKSNPNVPQPFLAPDLCVNVQTKDGKLVAQLLGFERKQISFDSLGMVNKSNVVSEIYETLRK